MRSTSSATGSTDDATGAPAAGTGSLPRMSSHRSSYPPITAKSPPTAWATIVGRSAVRERDAARRWPSHASQTANPSAIAVPSTQKSVWFVPGAGHRGSASSRSSSLAESAPAPASGWCSRRPKSARTSGASTRFVIVPS